MCCPEPFRGPPGQLRFTVLLFRKTDGKGMDRSGVPALGHFGCERNQRGGVDAAAEENADGNVSDQVLLHGFMEQGSQSANHSVPAAWLKGRVFESLSPKIPIAVHLGARPVAVRSDQHAMAGRQREHTLHQRRGFGNGPE